MRVIAACWARESVTSSSYRVKACTQVEETWEGGKKSSNGKEFLKSYSLD